MKILFVVIVGVIAIGGLVYAQTGSSSEQRKNSSRTPAEGQQMNQPPSGIDKQAVDMTDNQRGTVGEYDVVPVPRGELVDAKGGRLNQTVKNPQGETLGTVTKLLKDKKTGKIEYAVLELEDKFQRPMQWSQFMQQGDKLILKSTKNELRPSVNPTLQKDLSPDVSQYMDQINKVREEPKRGALPPQDRTPGYEGSEQEADRDHSSSKR